MSVQSDKLGFQYDPLGYICTLLLKEMLVATHQIRGSRRSFEIAPFGWCVCDQGAFGHEKQELPSSSSNKGVKWASTAVKWAKTREFYELRKTMDVDRVQLRCNTQTHP